MSAKIMQDLALRLTADTAELKRGVAEANKSLKSIQGVGNQVTSALKGVAAGMAAAFTAKAIVDGIKNTIIGLTQMADRLLDLEQITGANTDTLQEWQYVAKISGVNTEAFSNAVEGLTQRMARGTGGGKDFNDAIKQLNISIRDSNGELRNGADVTEEAIEKLAAMDNVTQRNILGAKLFTGAWKDLAPILGNGKEGINELREEAHRLGVVLSSDELASADELRKNMVEFDAAISGLRNTIVIEFVPALTELTGGFIEMFKAFKPSEMSNFERWARIIIAIERKGLLRFNQSDLMTPVFEAADLQTAKDRNSRMSDDERNAEILRNAQSRIDKINELLETETDLIARETLRIEKEYLEGILDKAEEITEVIGGGGLGTKEAVGLFEVIEAQIKDIDEKIKNATSFDDVVSLTVLKQDLEDSLALLKENVTEAATLQRYLNGLGGEENIIPTKATGSKPVEPFDVKKPPIPILKPKEITVFKDFNDYLKDATNNVWNLIDAASLIGDAFGKSFTDAQGALKGLVSGMLQLAKSILMVAIAEHIKNSTSGIMNWLTSGSWGTATAVAGVAAITAAWNSIKLADGGLAYGETLATVGEYAGAKSNPEVIAPLSDLKGIIAESINGGMGGEVRFVIEEDKLVGILNRYNKKQIYF